MLRILSLLLLLVGTAGYANKLITVAPDGISPLQKNFSIHSVPPSEWMNMKIKDIEKLSGRKFSLKEKIAFRFLQHQAKRAGKITGMPKENSRTDTRRSKTALWLGIFSLATVLFIPVSVVLAVISIVLASKSLNKNNEDKKAKAAMGLSLLALGIIVVGLLIYAIFISDGAFKLFTIG